MSKEVVAPPQDPYEMLDMIKDEMTKALALGGTVSTAFTAFLTTEGKLTVRTFQVDPEGDRLTLVGMSELVHDTFKPKINL